MCCNYNLKSNTKTNTHFKMHTYVDTNCLLYNHIRCGVIITIIIYIIHFLITRLILFCNFLPCLLFLNEHRVLTRNVQVIDNFGNKYLYIGTNCGIDKMAQLLEIYI